MRNGLLYTCLELLRKLTFIPHCNFSSVGYRLYILGLNIFTNSAIWAELV